MHNTFRKKIISAICTAVTAVSSLTVFPASPAAAKGPHVTVLGDSLGTNYNLKSGEYGYSDYIADYLKAGTYSRFSQNGQTSGELLYYLQHDPIIATAVSDSDVILVTIGSNDMLNALKSFVAANANEGEGFKEYALRVAKSGQQAAEDLTFDLNRALRTPRNTMLDNLKLINTELRELNPDAKIVFQKLYNPFESKTTVYNGKDYSEQYQTFLDYIRGHFKQINNGIEGLKNSVIADPYTQFRDHAWIYTFSDDEDVHPNALGHAVMAAETLEKLGYSTAAVPMFGTVLKAQNIKKGTEIPVETIRLLYDHAGFGDVDGDGEVTAFDSTLVLREFGEAIVGVDEEDRTSDRERISFGDVDMNGEVTAYDSYIILKYFGMRTADIDDVTMYDLASSLFLPSSKTT